MNAARRRHARPSTARERRTLAMYAEARDLVVSQVQALLIGDRPGVEAVRDQLLAWGRDSDLRLYNFASIQIMFANALMHQARTNAVSVPGPPGALAAADGMIAGALLNDSDVLDQISEELTFRATAPLAATLAELCRLINPGDPADVARAMLTAEAYTAPPIGDLS